MLDAGAAMVQVVASAPDFTVGPAAGVVVVFSNADGSVAAKVLTDGQGLAAFPLPDGGSVSLVWQKSNGHLPNEPTIIATVMGVKPGETVNLTMFGAVPAACTPYTTTAVTLPAFAGAADYQLYDAVVSQDFHTSLTGNFTFSSCTAGDLLAVAFDGSGTPIATSEKKNINVDAPPAVTMPPFVAVGTLHTKLAHADLTGSMLTLARTGKFFSWSAAHPTAPTIDVDFPAVDEGWGDMRVVATVTTAAGTRRIDDPIAPGSTSHTIDLGTDLPATTLATHYADRTLDVTPSAPFAASYLYVHFTGTTADQGLLEWHVLAAPTTTTLVIPSLPPDLAALDLALTSTPRTMLVQSDSIPDWSTSHQTLFRNLLRTFRGTAGLSRVRTIEAP